MSVLQTALGQAVESVRGFLSAELQDRQQPSRVDVGNLAENAPSSSTEASRVNLLVTRIESDGSTAGISYPWEPWLVRLHVLVTAFTTNETPSVGQNDLRLLGEVAAIFHEHPILELAFLEGIPVRLNVTPENISTETLNQLWAIQGEVGFRTSLAYDISLVPIRTDAVRAEAPLAGEVLLGVNGDERNVGAESRITAGIADLELVDGGERYFRRIERGDLPAFSAGVWVTSDEPLVRLVWELLDTRARWQRVAPAGGLVSVAPHARSETPDPAAALPLDLPQPNELPAAGAFQLVLRALADGADLTARALPGQPVVISVFEP
ncbi:MAG: hypothetical protein QOH61_575 [Chloroflexota bacterium]|jgi:hypothetical protein|nr:hypothetical protein [Chloroflexota bacterium]